ncbi:uncharacterized protein LOC143600882 [Bidens hawaiensis]|uniref:uncharacterized protein LOC143600882 n=1 Tax=Bidens hawaiensis TaxID=980011 RepID=UPI0040495838
MDEVPPTDEATGSLEVEVVPESQSTGTNDGILVTNSTEEKVEFEVEKTVAIGDEIEINLHNHLDQHRRYLVISGRIRASRLALNVITVYAPNDVAERRAVWGELLQVRRGLTGLGVLVGDFNEVRYASERLNSEFIGSNAEVFNKFTEDADLTEYQMGGGSFTYVSDRGDKFSKLDRILVCKDFMGLWPLATIMNLAKEYSDHKPLLLSSVPIDFKHIPFRFFNSWLDIPSFVDYVELQCRRFKFTGPADLAFTTKLRWLKSRIKWWLEMKKGDEEKRYLMYKQKLLVLEGFAESRPLSANELVLRLKCLAAVAAADQVKQKDLRQKARVRWALEGDENSSYFHAVLNANLSSNRIHGFMVNSQWIRTHRL